VITETSCAPTVTNCPAGGVHVTTITYPIYTTVCPVTKTPHATPTTYPAGGPITSTIYITKTLTLSHGHLTTATYTTTTVYPSGTDEVPLPPFSGVPTSLPSGEETSTISNTQTTIAYTTLSYVQPSTVTVIPTPKYPTGIKQPSKPVGSGTGVGTTYSPYPTTEAGGETTTVPGVPVESPSGPEFTGAGTKVGISGLSVLVVAFVAVLL